MIPPSEPRVSTAYDGIVGPLSPLSPEDAAASRSPAQGHDEITLRQPRPAADSTQVNSPPGAHAEPAIDTPVPTVIHSPWSNT